MATMTLRSKSILWLAQGFGIGRIPVAPGTFGSAVGLIWFLVLLLPGSTWLFFSAVIVSVSASIWVCGLAEQLLKETDPGSVVLDEIIAVPLCFGWWVGLFHFRNGGLPSPEYFLTAGTWPLTLGVFLAFRLFDVWKPWPIRQSQCLSGGLGVTIDDVLAAFYVNLSTAVAFTVPAIARLAIPELAR